jgi:hypothetical protein
MFDSIHLKYVLAAAVAAVVLAVMQSPARAEFAAPLLQCSAVAQPAHLTNCGTDPFVRGSVRIDDAGHMEVAVVGAAANATYAIQFRSPDGSHSTPVLDSLNTNASGNGHISKDKEFAMGQAGAGIVVLSRTGEDQFVSGFGVQQPGPDFRGSLVKCGDVNVPAALAPCGGDPLKSGSFDLESDDGDLTINLRGAAANQMYAAVIRAASGTQLTLGSVSTNSKGNGTLTENPAITSATVGSGTLVLTRNGSDEYLGGFKVTRTPGPRAASKSSLVRCIEVNLGPALPNCGTDPLDHGSAMIDQSGKASFELSGAAPMTTYELFFRPLDGSAASDMDTNVQLKTDPNGNGHAAGSFGAASGKTGSGSFVVKGGGFDQFVPGFTIK